MSAAEDQRLEWLAGRKKGIGGSDAAAVMGCSPWTSPYALWADKTTDLIDDRDSWPMRLGRALEPVVAQLYSEETGREVSQGVESVQHPEHEWMLANTDGTLASVQGKDGPGVLEIKTTSSRWKDEWVESPPLHYQVQLQHYLAVTGAKWGSFAVLLLGDPRPLRWMDVERNDRFIATLIEREREFWNDHVLAGVPPEADGSEATARALGSLHPKDTGEEIALPDEAELWSAEIEGLKKQRKQIDHELREREAKIKQAIGDASIARLPDGSGWSWKASERSAYTVEAKTVRTLRRMKARR